MSKVACKNFLEQAKSAGASDLHLVATHAPMIRVNGRLTPLGKDRLSAGAVNAIANEIVPDRLAGSLDEQRAVDFGMDIGEGWRARCNVYFAMGERALAFRLIKNEIPSLAGLKAPDVLRTVANLPNGLVLVTGPTGSGKSSTLAAMIECIGASRSAHIATIEDPVEFVHSDKASLITQREVGNDTPSFAAGLRDALREDPDVILVGEIRDFETVSLALRAAETGHLVLTTLHTSSAAHAIDRFIDAFPGGEKDTARAVLANTLRAVICQKLLPRTDGEGRIAAFEVLLTNPAIHNLIRENRSDQIISTIQTGSRQGMQTMQADIERLVKAGAISRQAAHEAVGGASRT